MIIIGEKIVLRAIETKDNEFLLSLMNDPETEKMLGGSSWPISKLAQFRWLEQIEGEKKVLRCIIATNDDSAVGTIILGSIDQKNGTGHIHIKMSKEGRGKGYATDAVNTLVKYAFNEMRLHCIYANILEYNEASVRLFEKCRFKREGLLRARVFKDGKHVNMYAYSRLAED